MASDIRCFYLILFAFLTAFASSSFISDDAFESRGSTGRTLLQAKGGLLLIPSTFGFVLIVVKMWEN
ncbi:hypothetical protein CsSME_00027265 [Camellia sinensis var. sinensis]